MNPPNNAPNLNFDIDALFTHLTENLGHEPHEPMEWVFAFRHDDVDHLAEIAESLSDEFQVDLQESVETHEDDRVYDGPPMLSVGVIDALTPDQVKALAARFAALADKHKLTYEGVSAYDPIDLAELEAFLDLEGAIWRLRSMADSGMPDGAPLIYEFCLLTPDKKAEKAARAALKPTDPAELVAEESPDDGPALLAYYHGTGDEPALTTRFNQVQAIATNAGCTLKGVRFLIDEDEDDPDAED